MTELTVQEFIEKMEWEGDVIAMLDWGGPECFPAGIQPAAHAIVRARDEIEAWLNEHVSDDADAERNG